MISFGRFASKIFGSSNDRRVKTYNPRVQAINALEPELEALSDEDLRARTEEFRKQLREGAKLDSLLIPAFATVREAAKRVLGQRHYDVQMIGGMTLHEGKIAEMKTGEGKTLVATLAVYLNALTGKGVHVVTVNDYLAKRDAEWMGRIYRFLGLTVGCIVNEMEDPDRRAAYAADVTYGTNNEFGFDYLRDNMKDSKSEMVQFGYRPMFEAITESIANLGGDARPGRGRRDLVALSSQLLEELDHQFTQSTPFRDVDTEWAERRVRLGELRDGANAAGKDEAGTAALKAFGEAVMEEASRLGALPVVATDEPIAHYFAIVDEVDSILIDEARTPLIISGPVDDRADLYTVIDAFMPELVEEKERFELDEKQRQVSLTETGNVWMEAKLGEAGMMTGTLYDIENVTIVHHVNQALRAHTLFQKDKDYIVRNNEVVIIDEFTGRMMPGRRYSEGLHQALEAKEHVEIQPENQTLASITFQNYFRLYEKLAGMTGTAATEADEFMDIYSLDVLEIPTNLPVARADEDDEIYRTADEKWQAIIDEIEAARQRKQPCLVGTASIEKSELLSELLKKRGVEHQVLNARYHEQEAKIISQAGVPGAVTIATNMAGRGTDIQLGGNVDVRIEEECAAITDPAEREKKVAEIRAEIEEARQLVLNASEMIEIAPAKAGKEAKTVERPGGLYVIGTERHESRRIDNQLRGRSGRQGDPGRSKFYLSLEDDLMRIFGSDKMDGMLRKLGLQEGEAITHPWMNKSLEMAQKKVEARNFDIRKHILKYDDVMNDQRKVVFEQRLDFMSTDDVSEIVADMRNDVIDGLVKRHIPENAYAEQWDMDGLKAAVQETFDIDAPVHEWAAEEGIADEEIRERLTEVADAKFQALTAEAGAAVLDQYEGAQEMLRFIDGEPELKELLQKPMENAEAIGKLLLKINPEALQLNGVSRAEAQEQAPMIGYSFAAQEFSARQLIGEIDGLPEKTPEAAGRMQIRFIEKSVLLETLDHLWREHLVTLEHLREVIGFRAFGQRDPLNEYKTEAFILFEAMLTKLREAVTSRLMHLNVNAMEEEDLYGQDNPEMQRLEAHHEDPGSAFSDYALADAAIANESNAWRDAEIEEGDLKLAPVRTRKASTDLDPNDPSTWGKVARNAPCPCGSGKKYKQCHGRH